MAKSRDHQISVSMQMLVGAVAGVFVWAGIEITLRAVYEQAGMTFGSLLLAAPLFSTGLIALFMLWFIRQIGQTNQLLEEIVEHNIRKDRRSGAIGVTPATRQPGPSNLDRWLDSATMAVEPGTPVTPATRQPGPSNVELARQRESDKTGD